MACLNLNSRILVACCHKILQEHKRLKESYLHLEQETEKSAVLCCGTGKTATKCFLES